MAGVIERLDAQLEHLFAGWNLWSTTLALGIVFLLLYPLFFAIDPDTHPLLLSRQAQASPVREAGESAVYRSIETPHGFPLRSGLNVKDPGASRWSAGRDGDLRDIWRRVVGGMLSQDGQPTGQKGKIMTVYGKEELEEHSLDSISCQINIVGQYLRRRNAKTVAICLPNSVEVLISIFAAAFYDFTPVLIPYGMTPNQVCELLQRVQADYLIAAAGALPLAQLKKDVPAVNEVMWVVEKTSRQMDWSEPSEGVITLHELVEEQLGSVTSTMPENNDSTPEIIMFWTHDNPVSSESAELSTFSQSNIIAAVGAQITALPSRHRVTTADVLLPADLLTNSYVLIQTLAALFSNASVVFNSVAGTETDLAVATSGVAPTILIASPQSLLKLHSSIAPSVTGGLKGLAHRTQTQALDAGFMPPTKTVTSRLNPPVRAKLGKLPSKLRLIYTYERLHAGTPPVSSQELSDLRAFTGARIIYALTSAKVAGAVTQTGFYDYRRFEGSSGRHSHFGVPVSCVEVKVVDTESLKTIEDRLPEGEIVVSGPAVPGGSTQIRQSATFKHDGTLAFV